jgi:hypothetical protein
MIRLPAFQRAMVKKENLLEPTFHINLLQTATLTYDDPPSADAAIQWFGGNFFSLSALVHDEFIYIFVIILGKEFMGNVIEVTKAERKMSFRKFFFFYLV